MKKQKLPDGMTHESIQATISKFENQSGKEAVADLEAAISRDEAFVSMQVPISRLDEVLKVLASAQASQGLVEIRKVAETKKNYPSKKS